MRQLCLLTTLIVASGTTNVAGMPLTPFRYETQAQRHCPDDTVVWLDFRKGIYYFKRQNRYAQGSTGSFVVGKKPGATAIADPCLDFGKSG